MVKKTATAQQLVKSSYTKPMNTHVDVIIIGGSYAGLAAAMSLGRSLRTVLVIDSGNPCNKQTPHSHNFITHDGESPATIAEKAKAQVLHYKTISFINGRVTRAEKNDQVFDIETEKGEVFHAEKLIFATGLKDVMPEIKGFSECWGISVLHCPYCHGYEFRAEKTGILANGDLAFESCRMISHWTKELTLFTNGASTLSPEQTALIRKRNIEIIQTEISALEHTNGHLELVVLKDGNRHSLRALYARPQFHQHCNLPEKLGCELTEQGLIKTDMLQKTNVTGVYVAGDSTNWGRAVSLSVASGSMAGMSCNRDMIEEKFL